MPMVRCPYCALRQYAPTTHTTPTECAGCGRPFDVSRETLIAGAVLAARERSEISDHAPDRRS
jgi:sarcosine oxidase delta subunit